MQTDTHIEVINNDKHYLVHMDYGDIKGLGTIATELLSGLQSRTSSCR